MYAVYTYMFHYNALVCNAQVEYSKGTLIMYFLSKRKVAVLNLEVPHQTCSCHTVIYTCICVHVHVQYALQATVLSSKLSQSSAAIIDQKPVTADDLDDVLKNLAKFNMGSPRCVCVHMYINIIYMYMYMYIYICWL